MWRWEHLAERSISIIVFFFTRSVHVFLKAYCWSVLTTGICEVAANLGMVALVACTFLDAQLVSHHGRAVGHARAELIATDEVGVVPVRHEGMDECNVARCRLHALTHIGTEHARLADVELRRLQIKTVHGPTRTARLLQKRMVRVHSLSLICSWFRLMGKRANCRRRYHRRWSHRRH